MRVAGGFPASDRPPPDAQDRSPGSTPLRQVTAILLPTGMDARREGPVSGRALDAWGGRA